jgi:RND family efflux transporter MFP subunit
MNYTHIVAPFSGVVTGRFVDPGALIQATGSQAKSAREGSAPAKGENIAVVSLADIAKLRVYVYVPENETSAIRVGMPAQLTLKEFPGRVFTGTVARFTKSLDLSTRTMLTEVELANPDGALYPGMYADVRLDLARHPDALQVPSTAVGQAETGPYLYVVRDDRLRRAPVTLGIATEGWVEATSGIADTDAVVRNLSPELKDGEVVEPLPSGTDATSLLHES